jgi:hypothetical protein
VMVKNRLTFEPTLRNVRLPFGAQRLKYFPVVLFRYRPTIELTFIKNRRVFGRSLASS